MSSRISTCFIVFGMTASIGGGFTNAQDMPLSQILIDGEPWQLVAEGYKFTEGPAADQEGNVYFTDVPAGMIYKVDSVGHGDVTVFDDSGIRTSGLMFGSDGKLYAARPQAKQIVRFDMAGKVEVLANGVTCNDLVVARNGNVYFTDPKNTRVALLKPDGTVATVAEGFQPNGIILWQGQGTLVTTDQVEPWLWTYRVEDDGSLSAGDKYYGPLVIPPKEELPRSDGMTVDDDGRLYLASAAGVQVFDTTGRPSGVLLKPQAAFLSNVVFGGPKFDTLYVTCQDKVYRRKLKVTGRPYFLVD